MTRFACLAIAAACLPASGCGTSAHLFCGPMIHDPETHELHAYPRYYGGVWTDRQMIRKGHYIHVLDLPFSFVADSVLAALDVATTRRKPAASNLTATQESAGPDRADTSAGR